MTIPWKICRQNSESFLLEFRKGWKTCALSKHNNFAPKSSSEHAQWNFSKSSVTLLPKKKKNFPELQKCWSYNFWNKLIFPIKNDSLATGNATLTTVANTFLWESTHLQLRFRKPRKKNWTFRKEKNFPKNVPMYMYKSSCDHPAEVFSSKLWKIFAGFLEMRKN